jgi:hypothetical protein
LPDLLQDSDPRTEAIERLQEAIDLALDDKKGVCLVSVTDLAIVLHRAAFQRLVICETWQIADAALTRIQQLEP